MAIDSESVGGCLTFLGIALLVCVCLAYMFWGDHFPFVVSLFLMGIPVEMILLGLFVGSGKGR